MLLIAVGACDYSADQSSTKKTLNIVWRKLDMAQKEAKKLKKQV